MAALDSIVSAARLPGPPELLPGSPDAIVDLQTEEGVALVGGRWRYADARVEEIEFVELGSPDDPLGPGTVPNTTYDVVRSSEWRELAPHETQLRLANGRVCFNWYAIDVTVPERFGELDPTGATVVTGGEMVDPREVGHGELRASAIDGGERHALGDGDVLAIPSGVPHQFVEVSDPFLYFVVKVEA